MGWYSDIQVNYLMFSLPYMVTSMQLLGSASLHSMILNISIATLPLLFVSIFIRLTSHFFTTQVSAQSPQLSQQTMKNKNNLTCDRYKDMTFMIHHSLSN